MKALLVAHSESRQGDAFQQQMRAMFHQHAVFEGTWLAFVGIADDIFLSARLRPREIPLQAGGEGCAAASDKTGCFNFGDHIFRCHLGQRLAQRGVIAVGWERLRG